eukprot:35768_1
MAQIFAVIAFVLGSILLVPFCFLAIFFYKNICCKNESYLANNKITIWSIIVFSLCFVGYISLVAGDIYAVAVEYNASISTTFGLLYAISWLIYPLIFILRIHYTFTGPLSTFACSAKTIKLLYISYIFMVILFLVFVVSAAGQIAIVLTLSLPLWVISYLIIYIVLIVLFLKKVIVMIRYKVDYPSNKTVEMEENPDNTNNTDDTNNAVIEITSINTYWYDF